LLSILLLCGGSAAMARPLIWAFGDSLTAGYGLPPAQGLHRPAPVRAAALRHTRRRGRNGGVSGDTAAQGRARLLWGLRGLGTKPDLVIVELGANDMLRGLPPAQTATNLDRILTELRRRRIPVLLAGMRAAPNLGAAYRQSFEGIYPALAKRHDVPLYPFFLDGVAGQRALNQRDGLHPTAQGIGVIVRGILPSVKQALKQGR
jgi:acyl-CoA thioesterase-1